MNLSKLAITPICKFFTLCLMQIACIQVPAQTDATVSLTNDFVGAEALTAHGSSYIESKLIEHTNTVTAKEASEKIPIGTLYRDVYIRIIVDGKYRSRLGEDDLAIIDELPDHTDTYFQTVHFERVKAGCEELQPTLTSRNVLGILSEFESIVEASDRVIEDHYEFVWNSLSNNGKTVVSELVADSKSSGGLTYSWLDTKAMAKDVPEFINWRINAYCSEFQKAEVGEQRSKLLRDSINLSDGFLNPGDQK